MYIDRRMDKKMETTIMGYTGIIGYVLGFCNGSHYIIMGSTSGCIEVCKFIVPITENTSHMANGNKWEIITHEMQTTTCGGCERLLQYHTYIYIHTYIHIANGKSKTGNMENEMGTTVSSRYERCCL